MNIRQIAVLFLSIGLLACAAGTQETAPTLPLSAAAKLAEDAIASASLPADCFLRSLTIVRASGSPAYYRAIYKPTAPPAPPEDAEPKLTTLEVIRITMDGKVSFEKEEVADRRRRIRVK